MLPVVDGALIVYKVGWLLTNLAGGRGAALLVGLDGVVWLGLVGYAWRVRIGWQRFWTATWWAYLTVALVFALSGAGALLAAGSGAFTPDGKPDVEMVTLVLVVYGAMVTYRLAKAAVLHRYIHQAPELWGRPESN
jgi:hypothetical protein